MTNPLAVEMFSTRARTGCDPARLPARRSGYVTLPSSATRQRQCVRIYHHAPATDKPYVWSHACASVSLAACGNPVRVDGRAREQRVGRELSRAALLTAGYLARSVAR